MSFLKISNFSTGEVFYDSRESDELSMAIGEWLIKFRKETTILNPPPKKPPMTEEEHEAQWYRDEIDHWRHVCDEPAYNPNDFDDFETDETESEE